MVFFYLNIISSSSTRSCDFRVHRAGSQLKSADTTIVDTVSSKIDVTLFIQVRYATNSFKMKNAIYVNVQTDIPRFADIGNEKKGVEEAKNVHIFTGRTVCL